ncbi:MAG: hypothetical protein RR917_02235 [Eggerthellaceae bacterium]
MEFPETVLEAIKARFVETNAHVRFGGTDLTTRNEYYVMHLADNLVDTMAEQHKAEYSQGRGVELNEKMRALRSSAAMTFNVLGNETVRFAQPGCAPTGTYSVSYEYQLPLLAGNSNCANLDARLVLADTSQVVYCEMKMAEWLLGWPKLLRASYFDRDRYLIPAAHAQVFIEVFESLVKNEVRTKGSRQSKYLHFDALQMTKHLLALYGNIDNEPTHNLSLINCVWEINDASVLGKYAEKYRALLDIEHEEFADFTHRVRPILELFENRGINFSLSYTPLDQFLACIDKTEAQKKKLARYLL